MSPVLYLELLACKKHKLLSFTLWASRLYAAYTWTSLYSPPSPYSPSILLFPPPSPYFNVPTHPTLQKIARIFWEKKRFDLRKNCSFWEKKVPNFREKDRFCSPHFSRYCLQCLCMQCGVTRSVNQMSRFQYILYKTVFLLCVCL